MRLGGLGLTNPMSSYGQEREASEKITASLVERVLHQDHRLTGCHAAQKHAKAEVRSTRRANQKKDALKLQGQFPVHMQHCMELAQEKRASSCCQHCQLIAMVLLCTRLRLEISHTIYRHTCMHYMWTARFVQK